MITFHPPKPKTQLEKLLTDTYHLEVWRRRHIDKYDDGFLGKPFILHADKNNYWPFLLNKMHENGQWFLEPFFELSSPRLMPFLEHPIWQEAYSQIGARIDPECREDYVVNLADKQPRAERHFKTALRSGISFSMISIEESLKISSYLWPKYESYWLSRGCLKIPGDNEILYLQSIGHNVQSVAAYDKDKPVAVSWFVTDRPSVYWPMTIRDTDEQYRKCALGNSILYWAMRWYEDKLFSKFDLGIAFEYKKYWSAHIVKKPTIVLDNPSILLEQL